MQSAGPLALSSRDHNGKQVTLDPRLLRQPLSVRGATALCWECLELILKPGLPVPALVDGFDGQAVSPGQDSQGHIATHHLGKDLYIPAQTCFSL